jgi:predicted DNA-binding transcriptional regulator AlpA
MSREHPATRKWVSAKFLSEYFQVTQVTIWTWAREGKLPPPKKFSANCTRFDFEKISNDAESAA